VLDVVNWQVRFSNFHQPLAHVQQTIIRFVTQRPANRCKACYQLAHSRSGPTKAMDIVKQPEVILPRT
jgi:hypothetical protein